MLILAIYLLAFFVVVIVLLNARARLNSKQSIGSPSSRHTRKQSSATTNERCSACNGSGVSTQAQQRPETKMGTKTEYYTDPAGHRRSRTITKPKTGFRTEFARKACPMCGGSGRRATPDGLG